MFHRRQHQVEPLFGLGIGWQHSHWLRFDVTGEYRGDATFLRRTDIIDFSAPARTSTRPTSKSWLGLANAYIDMGNWCGFTPYVGAGIGFATISVNGLRRRRLDDPANGARSTAARTTPHTNFAWALYAGTSYDVTPQVTLDLTYR